MLRITAFIGGVLLLIMAAGGYLLRPDDTTLYWVLSREDGTPSRWYFMLFDRHTPQPLGRIDSRIMDAQSHFWWSPDSEWLFYQRHHGQTTDLMRVHPISGTPEVMISPVRLRQQEEYHPTLHSPDGRWMVINSGDQLYGITIANADGSGARELFPPTVEGGINMYWSRDSQWVYYLMIDPNTFPPLSTYRVHLDGSATQLIYADLVGPIWSPDGEWLVFQERLGNQDILKVRADGSEVVPLVSGLEGYQLLTWLENDWILLDKLEDNGARNLYMMRPTGANIPHLLVENSGAVLSWTPDGERLFLVRAGVAGDCVLMTFTIVTRETICQANAEGQFTINGWQTSPQWTLFEAIPDTQISEHPSRYLMAAERDGSQPRMLLEITLREDFPSRLSATPDGEWVIYSESFDLFSYKDSRQQRIRITDGYVEELPAGYHETVSPAIEVEAFESRSILFGIAMLVMSLSLIGWRLRGGLAT